VASTGAVGLPRFRFTTAPIGSLSINTSSYYKLMFVPCSHDCGVTSLPLLFFLRLVRKNRVNRDSALHSKFHKQYAPTSAEPKNDAAQNQASPLSSYLTQRVANTPLHKATMLAATSTPKIVKRACRDAAPHQAALHSGQSGS
jgi:hypothetical protein